jgi:outer membrane protein assembly factor BamB
MRTRNLAMILGAALCLPGFVLAQSERVEPGDPPIMKPMLVATEAEVMQFDQRGEVVWRTPSGVARDVWQLENGNVLFPFNQAGSSGVREVAWSGETVWEYRLPGQYVISCQRLKNGNTLVGAACRGAVLVVNPQGEIVHSIKLRATHKKHSATIVRRLDNGHILVVEESARFVAEYTLNGNLVWEIETPFSPFGAQRLKNGHTLISGQTGLIEVTPKKHIVWRLAREDVKEMGPRWFAGFRLLPNGNIMVCNAGGTVPFFEVNRQKQVVWHTGLTKKQIGIAHGLYVLDEQYGGGSPGQIP